MKQAVRIAREPFFAQTMDMAVTDWTDTENDLIVADYFEMLGNELLGASYNKAECNRNLQLLLPSRNRASIEFKHQNTSAVLLGLGQPWINGYKPAQRFQMSLVDAVLRWLDARPDWLRPTAASEQWSIVREESALWIGPAPTHANEPPPVDPDLMAAIGKKYDVAERDARNRSLGRAGEERILAHEKAILRAAGRSDLAEKVRWTAIEDGDGFGYDIASFEPDETPRLLEIKTTNGWERTPFHISRNELAVAESNHDHWQLIRLWNFACEPRAFALRPPLDAHFALTPTSFLASMH
jgi:Domain of unknown function (DUF3883)